MRAVGLTLVLLVACGRACEFLEGAEDHISIQVTVLIILAMVRSPS